ncbi:MAG: sulfatase [Saprospiraceae bacterium]|nr:sulfatase [Saprospiraceae bacterium]
MKIIKTQRTSFLLGFLFLGLLFSAIFACQRSLTNGTPKDAKLNVVVVLVDDLGWKDLACYGSVFYDTPKLDAFAKESLRFTQAYAASPVCSPTRAALMTGRHPVQTGITDWLKGQNPPNRKLLNLQDRDALALEEYTLAELFKDNGYQTFFAGKWHLGEDGYFPEDQGFDFNKGGHHRGSPPGGYFSPYRNPKLSDGPAGEYLTDRLTDETLAFIQAQEGQKQPFFAMLSYYTVHTPIQANPVHMESYSRKLPGGGPPWYAQEGQGKTLLHQKRGDYGSMVTAMDHNVGRLIQSLKDAGQWENTILIFTSDNGGLTTLEKNREAPTAVRPLRAGKGWCYEGGIRIPLMIRIPKLTEAGQEVETPVISQDLFPTLVEILGLESKGEMALDGVSLMPLLKNSQLERDKLIWHFPHYHGSAWKPGAAIRQGQWKLVKHFEEDTIELFDLSMDIGETKNLAADNAGKAKELEQALLNGLKLMNAQFPVVNPNFSE